MIQRTPLLVEMSDADRRNALRALQQDPDDPAAYSQAVSHIHRSTAWSNPESKAAALADLSALPRGGLGVLRKKKKEEVAVRAKDRAAREAAWWAGAADRKKAEAAIAAKARKEAVTLTDNEIRMLVRRSEKRRAAAKDALAGARERPLDPYRQARRFRSAVERAKNPKKR